LLPSWVTGLGPLTRLGWLGPAQPMLVGLDPATKKRKEKRKESGSDLGFRLSRPKLCLLKVCLAKHTLMPWS